MKCKICQHNLEPLFNDNVLNKYSIQYYQCPNCEFIQTEKPYWLEEAYQNAITDLDLGLVSRNIEFSNRIYQIISNSLNYKKVFLDYAGGYGLFVRLMRDKGLDFYHYDKYCQNILATNYDLDKLKIKNKFQAVTALEFFEHLENPLTEIKKILTFSDTIIFSTELIPKKIITYADDWWYFSQETGQHIAFYSQKTFQFIAKLFKVNYYNQDNLHIFSHKSLNNPFSDQTPINLPSLL
ncbi:methyltransferase domain-containing protein, partial [bacterium]|nr:methyltransferase domain-containing protein [bacterium]